MKFLIVTFAFVFITSGGFPVRGSSITDHSARSDQQGNVLSQDTAKSTKLLVRPFQLDIVPPSSGVQFYKNGIIFLSHSKIEEKVPEKHLSFGSLKTFMALTLDTVPGDCIPFIPSAPNVFPSEATTFTEDYNTMYVSLIPERDSREKIFRATLKSNNWVFDDTPLEFCKGNYIYSHPTLAAKGDFMIFSSDMVGSAGDLDLFISRKEGDKWANPENIGKHINTSGNELFASLDAENNLYFSSDGLPGEGGYDVFVCNYNGKGWDKPHNLSAIINSRDDEVAFTVSRSDRSNAFFTSRTRFGKSRTLLNSVTLQPSSASEKNIDISKKFIALAGIGSEYSKPVNEASEPRIEKASAKEVTLNSPPVKSIADKTQPAKNIANEKKIASPPEKPTTASTAKSTAVSTEVTTTAANLSNSPISKNAADKKDVIPPASNPTNAPFAKSTTDNKEATTAASKPAASVPAEADKDVVIYRVQILANTKPIGSKSFTVDGKSYKSFEYLYMGGYRTTIGECQKLAEATALQNACRRNGYNQAFVVAFKNNIRSNDPALFK